jgi:DNA-directed RNA polymerase subunit alpha
LFFEEAEMTTIDQQTLLDLKAQVLAFETNLRQFSKVLDRLLVKELPSTLNDSVRRCEPGLCFSKRIINILERAGIFYFWQLVQKRDSDLLRIENFGRGALMEVKDVLAKKGLALGLNLGAGFVMPDNDESLDLIDDRKL